jgi:hypothetical protein
MGLNALGKSCPNCDSQITKVVATTRSTDGQIIRRRWCEFCNHRYYTAQSLERVVADGALSWLPVPRSQRTRPVRLLEAVQ